MDFIPWLVFALAQLFIQKQKRVLHVLLFLEKGVFKICSKFTGKHLCRIVIWVAASVHIIQLSGEVLDLYLVFWRSKYFFWYCINTTECWFNKFIINTVNAIRKKFVWLHKMGKQIKSSLLLTLLQEVYSYFSFPFPAVYT